MTESGESALTKVGEFTVTPILAILMVVGGALFLVFLIISAVFCFRKKRRPPHKSSRFDQPLCLPSLLSHLQGRIRNIGGPGLLKVEVS